MKLREKSLNQRVKEGGRLSGDPPAPVSTSLPLSSPPLSLLLPWKYLAQRSGESSAGAGAQHVAHAHAACVNGCCASVGESVHVWAGGRQEMCTVCEPARCFFILSFFFALSPLVK